MCITCSISYMLHRLIIGCGMRATKFRHETPRNWDFLPAKFDETRKNSTKQGFFVPFRGLFEKFCFGSARLVSCPFS